MRVVATNKATYVAYRGPWEAETFVRERMLDVIAADVGFAPEAVRVRNLLTADEYPTAPRHRPVLRARHRAETFEPRSGARRRRRVPGRAGRSARRGRLLGFGLATFVEPSPGPPDYSPPLGAGAAPRTAQRATARLEPDGSLTVFTSQSPHGQGHHTTLAQLAADGLGVPLAAVRMVTGDTQVTPFNLVGTGGSRAATLASGAVVGVAADIRAPGRPGSPRTCSKRPGRRRARRRHGVGARRPRLGAVARRDRRHRVPHHRAAPARRRPGIEAEFDFAIPEGGWSQATHCCWVEVDPSTGLVSIDRYLVVEDCGALINPTIVEGQIAGGVAQGIGGVLYERAAYDEQRPTAHVDVRRLPAARRARRSRPSRSTTSSRRRRARSISAASARAAPSARRPRSATPSPTRCDRPVPLSSTSTFPRRRSSSSSEPLTRPPLTGV